MKEKQNLNKNKKVQQHLTTNTLNTNACKICLRMTKTTNRLSCAMCACIFHVKCIPAKHKQHVPQDILMDLFICHNCYKEEDDDDDTINTEDNVNLEEIDSSAEDEEAFFILNTVFYLTSLKHFCEECNRFEGKRYFYNMSDNFIAIVQ